MKEYEAEVRNEMAKSPPTPEEWDRLWRSGYLSREGEASAAFAIVVLAKRTQDVGLELTNIANLLVSGVVAKMRGAAWRSKLSSLLFSPIVLDPAIAKFSDSVRKKKGGSVSVGVNIDHATWMRTRDQERINLVSSCLAQAFRSLAPTIVFDEDLKRVLAVLADVTNELGTATLKDLNDDCLT